jgi:apolipoprotein N-acyltransferase
MAQRRRGKLKSEAGAAGASARPRVRHSWGEIMAALAQLFALPLASAALLTLALPPANLSWVAYVALAPLVIMATRSRANRDAFWAAAAGGLAFFGVNLYWVSPITIAGYIALILYMALYWAVFGWGLRRMTRATRLPLTLLAPVLWVALEYVRGFGSFGMPWIYVGHTQFANLTMIQTADTLGAYGPSFLCLMTSGLIADLLTHPLFVRKPVPAKAESTRDLTLAAREAPTANFHEPQGDAPHFSRTLTAMILLTAAAWAATIGYGVWRMGQFEAGKREGPVVAVAQTCVPQEVKRAARRNPNEDIEKPMIQTQMDLTDEAIEMAANRGLKPDLVVWPETMVPGILNEKFLETDMVEKIPEPDVRGVFEDLQTRSRGYWRMIRAKAAAVGAPILFGVNSVDFEGGFRLPLGEGFLTRGPRYNTALLIAPESKAYVPEGSYAKVHLVPFGEYVPLRKELPWLVDRIQALFIPYKYDYSLTPGEVDQSPFTLKYGGGTARFQVAVCYEDALAYRIRQMTESTDPARPKAIDFVANISNDGWFNGSIELDQHLNLCVFRAVENRVAIVRSVNTGISAIIAPSGAIDQVAERDGRRRGTDAAMAGRLTFDDRVAPYTRVGDVFALACVAASAGLALVALIHALRRRKALKAAKPA